MNVGLSAVALVRVTVGVPLVWLHEYEIVSPSSGSELSDPSRVTLAPDATVWSGPAFAVGAWLVAALTVMVTVSVALTVPSLTVRVKTSEVCVETVGAVKVAVALVASVRVTLGEPLVCTHE